jgi:putative ABC transport system permease protein
MVISSLNKKLFRDLKNLRFQTFTTSLLLICGVAIFISSWSAYLSLKTTRDNYYSKSNFADIFAEFKTAPKEIEEKIRKIQGVDRIDSRIVIDGLVLVKNLEGPAVGRFVTIPKEGFSLNSLYLKQGRLPSRGPTVEAAVHEAFARAHNLKIDDELIVTIEGNRQNIKISGISISPEFIDPINPAAPLPDNRHFGVFWLSSKHLEYLAKRPGQVNSVIIKLLPQSSSRKVLKAVDQILAPYGNRGSYERKRQLSNMFVEDEIRQQKVTGMVVPFIFLAIAAFLVNIIITRLITLQRSQVATLKAIGYSDRIITFHYLKLIFLMLVMGAISGIFLGTFLGNLLMKNYRNFFHFPDLAFTLGSTSVICGFIAGIAPGIIGGIFTLRSIYKLTPAEAMRPSAPPNFLPTIFEKWNIQKYFNVRSRMVIRNLLLKPVRLIILILGLSTSLAIMITAYSWLDMINFITNTQFQRQQLEDITVAFQRPASEGAINELKRLEGVLMAEGYRNVPIRVKFKDQERDISLMGIYPKSQMFKILNRKLHQSRVPPSGMLVSNFFYDKWGLRKGDAIDIEFLEGAMKKNSLTIVGFTDDLIGLGAYIDSEYLLQVLKETKSFNVVKLKVDPQKINEIYSKLKSFPFISSVIVKDQMLHSFEETIGGMVKVFTYILISFATAITVGVIYNSIRVTFSERAWEMSSLMVLGFSNGIVFKILSLEVITQVLLAIMPGCFLGQGLTWLSMKMIHAETFSFPVIIYRSTFALASLLVLIVMFLSLMIIFKMTSNLKLSEALKVRE